MTSLTVAALQLAFTDTSRRISPPSPSSSAKPPDKGAKLILPPELFEGHYFCRTQDEGHFATRSAGRRAPGRAAMQKLAAELKVYIPTSFFEAEGHHHYNSLAMIDDKGEVMGVYRKSHIPDGPGYSEKFYFRPGNTGFKTYRDLVRNGRTGGLLGSMVSGDGPGADARRAPRYCSSRPRSAPSRTIPISTPAGCGGGR